MAYSIGSSRSLFVAAVLALPFLDGGCGREACFTWSKLEGACPAQSEALPFFSNPACPGKITSVESEGQSELDGSLCCYQVTKREESDESLCQGFGGANSSQAVGVDGSSGFAESSVGVGGASSCVSCSDAIGAPQTPICAGSVTLFQALLDCACSGPCSNSCIGNLCTSSPFTESCGVCLTDEQGCIDTFVACANDHP